MGAIVYENMSNDDYHNHKGSTSRSGIVEFMKSPAHYWNAYHNPKAPEKITTDAMAFGSAFHTIVLEPDKFDKEYAIIPEIDRRTKAGKETYQIFQETHHGKTMITKNQFDTLLAMQQSVYKHSQAWELISNARYENSIFWNDQDTGLGLKTRPDCWHANMTVDLKTISSADPRTFQNAMVAHGYHLQAAFNREGIRAATGNDIINHVFVCVEKTFPFLVAVYILDETALESAHSTLRRVLAEMKNCYETDIWPGHETQTLGLPNWAVNL
jgi:exodeoxyribonuclease VIII